MACWFFMSQITGRYTSSPETRMQEDLNRLDGVTAVAAEFVKILNAQIDVAVPDDWWRVTLPNNLHTSSAGAPSYVAYIAAMNILDADVLLATSKVKDWINPNRRTIEGHREAPPVPSGLPQDHTRPDGHQEYQPGGEFCTRGVVRQHHDLKPAAHGLLAAASCQQEH